MVKVICKGPSKEVSKEIICKTCGATLQYVPLDVKVESVADYGMGTDTIEYIICPECKFKVTTRVI